MLTILMPMAGLGSRFAAVGEERPKPLIPVRGAPMFTLALNSIRRVEPDVRSVAVVLRAHQTAFCIANTIEVAAPGTQVAVIPKSTGGALQTCLAAQHLIDPASALVVLDCDLTFAAPQWIALMKDLANARSDVAGALLSFRSREPRYSYAALDGDHVVRTAEKDPISDHALIGAYGFGSARQFFAVAADIVDRNERTGDGEFYISGAYNRLIALRGRVTLRDTDAYWSMGTPDELAACIRDPLFIDHADRLNASHVGL